MTKEECIALLIRYAEYDGMGIPNLAGCKEAMRMAAKLLSQPQPSLPSNLDVAAEDYGHGIFLDGDCSYIGVTEAFKAGAEWMAGQGVSLSHLIAWYIQSVDAHEPIWTKEHLEELVKDYILIPKN